MDTFGKVEVLRLTAKSWRATNQSRRDGVILIWHGEV